MALKPNEIATAIILCKRANLRGEEALAAVQAISALEREYALVTAKPVDKTSVESDERPATDRQSPAGS